MSNPSYFQDNPDAWGHSTFNGTGQHMKSYDGERDKYFTKGEDGYVLKDGYEQREQSNDSTSMGAVATYSNESSDYDGEDNTFNHYGIYRTARESDQAQEAPAPAATPTPPPERDPEQIQTDLEELEVGRGVYDDTRLDRPENNRPRFNFSDDPYKDAIGYGDDLNAHYETKFIPSLRAEAEQTSREIGFSGRNALNDFVGKVPQLGDPKDLFTYYSDQLNQSA
jgi:hypothetical protein